ncbi:glutathione-disulfide reductase [Rubrivivax gelatinosus]|uniref:glutathione-disulfide reductase n=1 Tax=Rubrivivax gelatinosus TaxID=28068 RepID=UPI001908B2A3|nr:glutathione-disulfide reductase [Rubrivivax gelatinosus]MBK1612008.1 glutathione-disulfide reductase [Rubrivivax gelatinosus]
MEAEFDLITIGAGSAGVAASRRAAALGARVAIVEAGRVGGTCVLRGCVPKKLLMYAAGLHDAFAEAPGYGWTLEPPRFEMARWAQAKAAETARLEAVYRRMLEGAGVEIVAGRAQLEDPNTVRIGDRRLRARHIVVATGASPARDTIPGIEACATSDELLDLQALPRRAAIVGGGYIAVEFASHLARLGVAVEMFYRDRLPLRGFDEMLRTGAAAALAAAGITLHPGNAPREVQRTGDGFLLVAADERARDFEWVLNATGRRPNTEGLPLELDERGALRVDARLQTSWPGVYAVGDVTDRRNLTPVAIAEGRAVAEMLFGGGATLPDLERVASAVFMLPPLATVGPSEAEALAAGLTVEVYETEFRPMRQAFVGGEERTRMKLLVDSADQRVLALHMLGADAPEIVQSLAVALTAGARKQDFDRTLALHPTAAEEFVLMRAPSRVVGPETQTGRA